MQPSGCGVTRSLAHLLLRPFWGNWEIGDPAGRDNKTGVQRLPQREQNAMLNKDLRSIRVDYFQRVRPVIIQAGWIMKPRKLASYCHVTTCGKRHYPRRIKSHGTTRKRLIEVALPLKEVPEPWARRNGRRPLGLPRGGTSKHPSNVDGMCTAPVCRQVRKSTGIARS